MVPIMGMLADHGTHLTVCVSSAREAGTLYKPYSMEADSEPFSPFLYKINKFKKQVLDS